jgi:hypothetical protein
LLKRRLKTARYPDISAGASAVAWALLWVNDSLGIAGSPGGVNDLERMGDLLHPRVHGRRRLGQDFVQGGDVAESAERSGFRSSGLQAQQPLDVRRLLAHGQQRLRAVVRADDPTTARVAQQEGQLVAARPRVDRHEEAPGDRSGDHGFDELGMVAHHDREAVPRLHASRDQVRGDAVGAGLQVGVGPDLVGCRAAVETEVLERQHVQIGLLFRPDLDQVGQDERVAFAHGFVRRGSFSASGC